MTFGTGDNALGIGTDLTSAAGVSTTTTMCAVSLGVDAGARAVGLAFGARRYAKAFGANLTGSASVSTLTTVCTVGLDVDT